MSDYLWDKTGEVDAEAERLEELLGSLRFQPRTFEVPATLPVTARRAPRTVSHFSWARLAVAASLVLVALAGARLLMTKQRATVAPVDIARAPSNEAVTPQQTQPTTPQPNKVQLALSRSSNVAAIRLKEVKPLAVVADSAARNVNRHLRRDELSRVVKRPGALPRQLNMRDMNAPREEIANAKLTPPEREAMEKFMLAMKVTSEKLNYAERQVAELNMKSPQR
jgi:hypothetical protein